MQATKKAPSFTRERFHTFLLTKNLLFSHDIIKVQFMNSNHIFDVNTKKRFNASLKKMHFFFIKCFFSLKNATFSLF